jgi:F-type H+-transporting ATPase subunit b
MLFGPLSKVIAQRDTLTSGARGEANDSLARAEAKVAEYQKAIEQARADIGRDQEQQRKQWLEEQAARMNAARSETDQKIAQAKAEIAKEAATVRQQLIDTTAQLADEIANTILKGKRA